MGEEEIAKLYVDKILALREPLDGLIEAFGVCPEASDLPVGEFSASSWRRNTYGHALVKVRQLLTTTLGLGVVDTMGVLSLARYVFEVSVWLRLFRKDVRYALVYYRELLRGQLIWHEDLLQRTQQEIELLKKFETLEEEELSKAVREAIVAGDEEAVRQATQNAMKQVDEKASRHFLAYFEQAKTNGYGFQAYLIEQKVVPDMQRRIELLKNEIEDYEKQIPKDVSKLTKGRWQWKQMAKVAGIENEHDHIYSYASRLLHATPSSISTDAKELRMDEFHFFVRYIHVKLLEIMESANVELGNARGANN